MRDRIDRGSHRHSDIYRHKYPEQKCNEACRHAIVTGTPDNADWQVQDDQPTCRNMQCSSFGYIVSDTKIGDCQNFEINLRLTG